MPTSAPLAATLVRAPRRPGVDPLQPRGTHGARQIATTRLCLDASAAASYASPGCESVAVLLGGAARATIGAHAFDITRRDVFSERATALFVPAGQTLDIAASAALEMMVFAVPVAEGATRTPAMVGPDQVEIHQRGLDGFTREVHDLFVRDSHVERLMVGETFNPAGHWSSYPPHKHDGRHGEPDLEEVYYYRIDPPQGFGTQVMYTHDGEEHVHLVRDGDVVVLPYGYHPVGSPPGYRLYYLWAMVGAERRLALYEDPAHVWVKG